MEYGEAGQHSRTLRMVCQGTKEENVCTSRVEDVYEGRQHVFKFCADLPIIQQDVNMHKLYRILEGPSLLFETEALESKEARDSRNAL